MPFNQTNDVILGVRREVDEICSLLGYYAAHGGNSLPTFRDNKSHPQGSIHLDGGTDMLYRKVGKGFPEERRSQVTLRYQNPVVRCIQYEFHRKFQCIFKSSGGTNAMSVGKCTRTTWL